MRSNIRRQWTEIRQLRSNIRRQRSEIRKLRSETDDRDKRRNVRDRG